MKQFCCGSTVIHTSSFPSFSFLLVNSVALHGDGCPICQSVEKELMKLSRDLDCSLQVGWQAAADVVRWEEATGEGTQDLTAADASSVCLASSVQSSQAPGQAADGCEGSQVLPPTPPIMLQVSPELAMPALHSHCASSAHTPGSRLTKSFGCQRSWQ